MLVLFFRGAKLTQKNLYILYYGSLVFSLKLAKVYEKEEEGERREGEERERRSKEGGRGRRERKERKKALLQT